MAKIKMKTHKGAAKRFKKTGLGKISHRKEGMSHILTKKTRKRKRGLRKPGLLAGSQKKMADKLLPYS